LGAIFVSPVKASPIQRHGMGSWWGQAFRIATFGESHGGAVGVVIEGCPPRIAVDVAVIQRELDRRRPGQSALTTPRAEDDRVEILSGIFEGQSLGTPILLMVRNKDARPDDYAAMKDVYRPSHADFTYQARYGIRNWQGGGRASARETIGRVAAGAVAQAVLDAWTPGVRVVAWVERVHSVAMPNDLDLSSITREQVEATPVRCPHLTSAAAMTSAIKLARDHGDSLGGVIRCLAHGVPAGLGDPVFDKLEADLAKGMLSLPAARSFEVGDGLAGTFLTGSQHNDAFVAGETITTATNRSGGIQGGISNGMPIDLRVGFKPTATIFKAQDTVNASGEATTLQPKGRHDPCVLPRAVPIVEAMVRLTLVDHLLRWRAIGGGGGNAGGDAPLPSIWQ